MKTTKITRAIASTSLLIVLCITLFSFTAKFGLDTYKIYLNKKLVLDLAVNQPKSSRILDLSSATKSDQLSISYVHCMSKGAGTGRSIVLRDEKGNDLKKWQFANAKGSNVNMQIAMQDLLKLEKSAIGHQFSLYYSSQELPEGEMLSTLRFK